MLNIEQMDVLFKAVKTFGVRNQEDVAIEEMSELIKALIKHRRYNTEETKENIYEEMADVFIMFCQLTIIYDVDKKIIDEKIERLKQRMESEVQGNDYENNRYSFYGQINPYFKEKSSADI